MGSHDSDRRKFLTDAALAGLAVGTFQAGTADAQTPAPTPAQMSAARLKETLPYGQPSQFDKTLRAALGGGGAIGDTALTTPLQDLDGIITPSGLHFLMDHVYGIPDIDPAQHRLMVHGMVDRPITYTLEELRRFPSVSKVYFIECNANNRPAKGERGDSVQAIHGRTSNSEWSGVLLSTLLKESGLKSGAKWIIAEGNDTNKYTMSIPIEKCMDDTLVAYAQNGEPVRPHNGYPLRLVVPGWEAIRCIKWLTRISVVDKPAYAWHEAGNNADTSGTGKALGFRFALGPNSVITRPSGTQKLPGKGYYEITGIAWTGAGLVKRVEVSVDGGKTYKEAKLQDPVLPFSHTRFRLDWQWDGQECVIQSRCIDEGGEVQPTIQEAAKVFGVEPEYFLQADHFNGVQPWRIYQDGTIKSATF